MVDKPEVEVGLPAKFRFARHPPGICLTLIAEGLGSSANSELHLE